MALLGVETWDLFRGVPNWTLICINVGVKWGVCIGVVVVSSKCVLAWWVVITMDF